VLFRFTGTAAFSSAWSFIMSDDLNIFDKHGRVRNDFTDAEIAALSPARQELWGALIAANGVMESAEADHRDAIAIIDKRVSELRVAETALADARPKITAVQAARAHFAAHRGEPNPPPDPATEKKILAAAAAVDKANESLAAAHRARNAAEATVKSARVVFSRALQNFIASGPIVKHRDLVRAVGATAAARAEAEKTMAGGPASHLDEILSISGGRRGPIGNRRIVPSER
jgi:hypothetical protein